MSSIRSTSASRAGRRTRGAAATPSLPKEHYSAAVLGDGSILPIVETLGRRLMREIDPLSSEGRALLDAGRVTLWYEDGARVETAPIQKVLDRVRSSVLLKRDIYPKVARWTSHHDQLLESIARMKRTLKPRP